MEYNIVKKEIILNRILSKLDKFVVDFCRNLENYVIVSGYVSIVFGRSRATEDIDLLVKLESRDEFKKIWDKLKINGFECLNTENIDEAFEMLEEHAIRFGRIGNPLPNMEFKLIKNKIDNYSFNNKIKLILGKNTIFISPLEMQIAYRLMLGKHGNKKDIEDAKHLYEIFKEKLNIDELSRLIKDLDAEKEFELIK